MRVSPNLTVPLAQDKAARIANGQRVIVGIRPEDLNLAEDADAASRDMPANGTWMVNGRIGVVEPLGSETLVEVDIDGHELTATAKGRTEPAVGSVAPFGLNVDNLHVFDQETQAAIR